MLCYDTGLIGCANPLCRSRFVVPLDDNDRDHDAEYHKKILLSAKWLGEDC